jgi:hypothetical protein
MLCNRDFEIGHNTWSNESLFTGVGNEEHLNSISNQGKKVVSCRPQAKIINRVVDEVCKCLRSARTLS